jgi:hypothetical protein
MRLLLPVLGVVFALANAAFAERELHVVGYHVADGGLQPKIIVDRPGQSVTLFLSAYNPINWQVSVVEGTTLERVFIQGYHTQTVQGVPAGVPVIKGVYEEGTPYVYIGYSLDSSRFLRSIPVINSKTGQEILSFHGGYHAVAETLINSVQDDPRLSFANPKPVPPEELPDVRYQIATWQALRGLQPVKVEEFTLSEEGGLVLLRNYIRISPDAAKQFYYGGDDGLTKVDAQTGQSQHIPLPEYAAREGWQMGTAFDTLRSRGLVVTLAGEGFTYAYNPANGQWSTAFSMQNRDFDCLEYHAATDTLWGVTTSYDDSVYAKLVGLKAADGSVVKEIQLPVFPFDIDFSSHQAEVVSTSEYLVLLIQPRRNFYGGGYGSIPESRIYLVDPRNGQLWLTYRSSAPANQKPQVQILSPGPDQPVVAGSKVRISASASDADGTIQSVEFFVDDVSLGFGNSAGGSTWQIEWTVPDSGVHTLVAIAKDNRGATGISQPVMVLVNKPPTVRLVQPENGATLQSQVRVDLKAIATDADGPIRAVHFIVDGLPIGPAQKVAGTDEYVLSWTPSRAGDHTIQARATDSLGAVAFSDIATVHVTPPPSSVVITNPLDGSSIVQFTRVELVAVATGADAMISVEFFVDGVSVGTARRLRGFNGFVLGWVARGLGEHVITARATSRSDEIAMSAPIKVTVTSEGGIARRLLPAQYRPGRTLRAGILVTPGRGAGSYKVVETPPAGWSVSEISDGGTYDAATGKITFGPIAADSVKLLTYSVTPPDGTKGPKTFAGTLEVDGAVTSILGQQTIYGPNAKRPELRWKIGVR